MTASKAQLIGTSNNGAGILRWLAIYCSIFMAITAIRFEVIDLPPYYDYAIGVWTEAIFWPKRVRLLCYVTNLGIP